MSCHTAALLTPANQREPMPVDRYCRLTRSSATHLLHPGSRDSLWRVTAGSCGRSSSWEAAETLTGLDAISGSSNGASMLSGRPGAKPARRRPAPALRGEMAAPRRRPAGGAAGRSLREGGARYRSGARRPAGTAPGSRPGPLPPACPRWSSSSGASRCRCLWCPPAVTGPGCSASSPVSPMVGGSTTATCPH
jgi:hypothetical protein